MTGKIDMADGSTAEEPDGLSPFWVHPKHWGTIIGPSFRAIDDDGMSYPDMRAVLIDAEGDPVAISYNEGMVEIYAQSLQYTLLTPSTLELLSDYIDECALVDDEDDFAPFACDLTNAEHKLIDLMHAALALP